MKEPKRKTAYYFVDEAGDPTFLGRGGRVRLGTDGCSPILALGYIECPEPVALRQRLNALHQEVCADPYFAGVPSMEKTRRQFHAKDDLPEIRMLVFRSLAAMDFKVQIVVGRKVLPMFMKRFHGSTNEFYEDLVSKLFTDRLHLHERNLICFSARSSKQRQAPYLRALRNAREAFYKKWGSHADTQIEVVVQVPSEEPCLQIVDYVLWAVYRAYTRGEMRFFEILRDKYSLVVDPYDRPKYPNVYYSRDKNPFHAQKISPLQLGPPRTRGM